jgi:hypothetical protein
MDQYKYAYHKAKWWKYMYKLRVIFSAPFLYQK